MSIAKFLSLVKFSHTLFAMPFALSGFALALTRGGAEFTWRAFFFMIVCMVSARNAAMAFNRWADRNLDSRNPRTRQRDIPSGKISPGSALWFVMINALIFIFSSGMLNFLCLILSPVALTVILGYSYTKRFTPLSHFVLGLGLSIAPVGAYLALTGTPDILPFLLSLLVLSWTGGFDIIYSLQDAAFDKKNQLHSLPAWLGIRKALQISFRVHMVSILLAVVMGFTGNFGIIYWAGTLIFAALLLWQHRIVRPEDFSRAEEAFFNGNSIASSGYSVFLILDLFLDSPIKLWPVL